MRTSPIALALLLLLASHFAEAADPQTDAVLVYNDGSQVVLRDWRFRYEFGASNDSPYEGRAVFYTPQSKESKELALEIEHGTAPALVIRAGNLKTITFDWDVEYSPPAPGSTISSTTVGVKTTVARCDGPVVTLKWPRPARDFLTDRRFLLETKLLLVGQTAGRRFSAQVDAYETNEGRLGPKVIREIRFQCSSR